MDALIQRHRGWFGVLVALAALAASTVTVFNQFTQDDVPLIVDDQRAADPGRWDEYLNEAYWPAPLQRDLYRPLTSLLIGAEWQIADGAPLPFRILQLTVYAASCIAFFALALRLLPATAAFAASLLFAVHPVHVEAVAVAVNQAEVLIGLLAAALVAWYVGRRRSGLLTPREQAALAGATLVAAHFKESGVMIPPLLFFAELLLLRRPWPERRAALTSLVVWQTLAVVVVIANRSRIEFATATGSFIAEAFEHQPIGGRLMTMLRIVPEWLRLLLWPATLSADYSPALIVPATAWGAEQSLGLAILALVAVLAWRLRTTTPVFTFGVAWCAVGLFPVHNVLVPTGIALAERTLFLPSVGVMLCVGAVVATLSRHLAGRRWALAGVAAGCLVVAVLGASRSHSRHQVWRNNNVFWSQAVIDNPDGYRPRAALGSLLKAMGHHDRAIVLYEQSLALWDRTWAVDYHLATLHRTSGHCEKALPHYRRVLAMTEVESARNSLVACLAWLGQYEEARAVALKGIGGDEFGPVLRIWFRVVDAAAKRNAPAQSVKFPEEYEYLLKDDRAPDNL